MDDATLKNDKKDGTLALKEKKSRSKNSSQNDAGISIISERELSRELGFKEAVSIGLGGPLVAEFSVFWVLPQNLPVQRQFSRLFLVG